MNYTNKIMVNFTTTPNHIIENLDLKELGLFVYLNSKPTGWNFASTRIASHFNITHKTCLIILKSLEAKGYLLREKQATGRMAYTLTFDEVKQESQTVKNAMCKKATVEKLHCVKIGQLSNNILLGNTIEEENIIKESSDSSSSEKSEESPLPKTLSKNKTTDKELKKQSEELFEIYPRHIAKQKALTVIQKVLKTNNYSKLKEKVKAYRAYADKLSNNEKQFIPYPATWFNQGRYDDELEIKKETTRSYFDNEEYGVATDFS